MADNSNIEDLFKEAFNNYEEPVRPELWTKISASIPSTPVQPGVDSGVSGTVSQTSSVFSGIGTWIAGAAIITAASLGVYFLVDSKSKQSNNQTEKNSVEVIDLDTPQNSFPQTQETSVKNPVSEKSQSANSIISNNNKTVSAPDENYQKNESGTVELKLNSETTNNSSDVKSEPTLQKNSSIQNQSTSNSNSNSTDSNFSINQLTSSQTSGTAPLDVNFNISGDFSKAEWNFGDGNSGSDFKTVKHTFNSPGNYTVTVKITDETGKVKQLSQNIEVESNLTIQDIPNIFTPNNDGRNDIFTFDTPGFIELEVSIYDNSGKFVHKFAGKESGWDGRLNSGQLAPEGTYIYIIFATAENNRRHQQKGTVTLKR